MENPYEVSQSADNPFAGDATGGGISSTGPGMVNHVRVVAILMMVQGTLALLTGGYYLVIGLVMPSMMEAALEADPNMQGPNGPSPEQFTQIMTITIICMGVPALIGGLLQIIAGILSYQFKGRGLTLASLMIGCLACSTMYCAPTAVAMTIYGLVVHFNQQVREAFAMRAKGSTTDQILSRFVAFRPPTH